MNYYLLSAAQRPLHPLHELLRPSGAVGLRLGVAGAVLIFLNLGYLLRRALAADDRWGSLRAWMSFHVLTGLLGPLLIAFHSAFVLRSALATIAALSLAVVAVTGMVGRYIYARTPRSVHGKELELEDLRRRLAKAMGDLQRLGLPAGALENGARTQAAAAAAPSLPGAILSLAAIDRENTLDYRRLEAHVLASPELRPLAASILPLGRRFFQERQWLARYQELRALMSGWRFFHKWFAIVMLIIAGCHVLVATLFNAF